MLHRHNLRSLLPVTLSLITLLLSAWSTLLAPQQLGSVLLWLALRKILASAQLPLHARESKTTCPATTGTGLAAYRPPRA